MSMDLRAVAYRPGGARIGVLPDALTTTLTIPRTDTPTVSMSYPAGAHGIRGTILDTQAEIAIEITHDGTTWTEPPGARFTSQKTARNLLGDGTDSRSLTAIHISHRLTEAIIWAVPTTAQDTDGKWNFLSASAGTILRTLWDAARARGWGSDLTLDATATADAAGAPWAAVTTMAFERGTTLAAVVEALVGLGMIDVAWHGRTMRVYNPDGALARDMTSAVRWPLGAGVTSAPETTTWAALCTDILVKGEDGAVWEIHNDQAPAGLRRIEKVVEAGGVALESTARMVAAATLATGATPAEEIKREWHDAAVGPRPFADYRPGDWILVERDGGMERLQVAQISITRDNSGVSGHTTLGTVLDSALARVAKRTKGIVGAAAIAGNTTRPTEKPAPRAPAVPTGLVVAAVVQTNPNGTSEAVATVDWADVTTDEHAAAVDVTGYEMAYRRADTAASTVTAVTASRAQVGPLEAGASYVFQVRALTNEMAGPWSASVTATMPRDITAPPIPSAPSLAQALGVITATWDQAGAKGESMPADFDHLDVSVQLPGTAPSPTTVMHRPASRSYISGLDSREYEVRFRTVDRSGNASAWGAASRITVETLVDVDAIASQVTAKVEGSEAVHQVARAETLATMAHLTEAMTQAAVSLVSASPYPPDTGTVDSSIWVSPDARTFVLRQKGN